MENQSEKRQRLFKEPSEIKKIQKFAVKVNQKLNTKRFHHPFKHYTTKKILEGQKSRKVVAKCKLSVGKFLLRYYQEKVPWIR
jgi:hypothetical protein